jgi:hypothetical protein
VPHNGNKDSITNLPYSTKKPQVVNLRLTGAGEGNRTLTTSLEGWGSTTELHPQIDIFLCDFYVALFIILKSLMLVKQVYRLFRIAASSFAELLSISCSFVRDSLSIL